jgi:hypothetical protein
MLVKAPCDVILRNDMMKAEVCSLRYLTSALPLGKHLKQRHYFREQRKWWHNCPKSNFPLTLNDVDTLFSCSISPLCRLADDALLNSAT